MIRVVAGAIIENSKVYICQRSEDMEIPLKWEFPGGKIKGQETDEEALKREISEELECEIVIGREIANSVHEYDDFTINLVVYMCELIEGTPNSIEHRDQTWVAFQELDDYDFAEADNDALEYLKSLANN